MTTYRVIHRTSYRYGAAMTDGYTVACLVPRPTDWQTVVDSEVRLVPEASERDSYIDAFGNLVNQFGLHVPHDEMAVEAVSVVDVANRPMPVDATPWEEVADAVERLAGRLAVEVGVYRASSTLVDTAALTGDLRSIADGVFEPGRPIVEAAAALCTAIFSGFEFDSGFSDVSTPLDEVLRERRGVCQDFAHLAIGCLRAVGLAARYVSGYIETAPPPGAPKLVGADASHAWCSVWTPNAGWVDFDPTNGHLPVNDHVTVAWGRDYADVTPVRGVMIGPATTQELDVSVDMARIDSGPDRPGPDPQV
ncbi:transglutaminase family protein [Ilumatobacter sp.]|uniref:transglutaminase family protein n=1 Tax=Ilumatobacter sp. TaxID=1967498 RepID=UPI003AF78E99